MADDSIGLEDIPEAPDEQPALVGEDGKPLTRLSIDPNKQSRILYVLAGIFILRENLEKYSLIFDTAPGGGFKKGAVARIKELARYLTETQLLCKGHFVGSKALQGWIRLVRTIGMEGLKEEQQACESGRSGETTTSIPEHKSMCIQAMRAYLEYTAQSQPAVPTSRYNTPPEYLAGVQLQKTPSPFLPIRAMGKEQQNAAVLAVGRKRDRAVQILLNSGVPEQLSQVAASVCVSRATKTGQGLQAMAALEEDDSDYPSSSSSATPNKSGSKKRREAPAPEQDPCLESLATTAKVAFNAIQSMTKTKQEDIFLATKCKEEAKSIIIKNLQNLVEMSSKLSENHQMKSWVESQILSQQLEFEKIVEKDA